MLARDSDSIEQLCVRTGAHEDDFLALGRCADPVDQQPVPANVAIAVVDPLPLERVVEKLQPLSVLNELPCVAGG